MKKGLIAPLIALILIAGTTSAIALCGNQKGNTQIHSIAFIVIGKAGGVLANTNIVIATYAKLR